jgi:signal transduction histidine kinase
VAAGDLSVRLVEPRRHDEVADLIRTFNAMTAQVDDFNQRLAHEVREATAQARQAEAAAMTQRRLAATGELAAGIAHEINNPLGGLQNAAQALGRPDLAPEKRERYIELLRSGLERIQTTVGQLLRFTPRRSATAPVRIERPVLDAMALVRHRARDEGVALRLSCGGLVEEAVELGPEMATRLGRLPPLEGEANELGQAILNLLVNALDALQEEGASDEPAIEIRLAVEGPPPSPSGGGRGGGGAGRGPRQLVLEISDNGPGVPQEELGRIGDLFYTTKEVGAGTGLGLAIVHNVVESHGGTLELSSRPGHGLRATMRFPVLPSSS